MIFEDFLHFFIFQRFFMNLVFLKLAEAEFCQKWSWNGFFGSVSLADFWKLPVGFAWNDWFLTRWETDSFFWGALHVFWFVQRYGEVFRSRFRAFFGKQNPFNTTYWWYGPRPRKVYVCIFVLLAIHSSHGDNVPMGFQEFPGIGFIGDTGFCPERIWKGKKWKTRKKTAKHPKMLIFFEKWEKSLQFAFFSLFFAFLCSEGFPAPVAGSSR